MGQFADVSSNDKCLIAGSCQYDPAHRTVIPSVYESGSQIVTCSVIQDVEYLGAVHCDSGEIATPILIRGGESALSGNNIGPAAQDVQRLIGVTDRRGVGNLAGRHELFGIRLGLNTDPWLSPHALG